MTPLPFVRLITDGSIHPNPGHGGWACIKQVMLDGEVYSEREMSGEGQTERETNSTMELTALREGLKSLNNRCRVLVVSDNEYLIKSVDTWIVDWMANGWIKSDGKPVLNQALLKEIHALRLKHDVKTRWVRGHVTQKQLDAYHLPEAERELYRLNHRADRLAHDGRLGICVDRRTIVDGEPISDQVPG